MERPLSELLKFWRAERPDEWTMDEFIREAERMEKKIQNTSSNSEYAKLYRTHNFKFCPYCGCSLGSAFKCGCCNFA